MKITNSYVSPARFKGSPERTGISSGKAITRLSALFGLALLLCQPVLASDPIGIYAIIDKVVFEPNDKAPERIQIWGTFSLAEGRGLAYKTPEKGYLYFELPKEKADVAKKEWNDFKSVAGKLEAVGFGQRYKETGKVRKASESVKNPDQYPLGFGLAKIEKPPKNYPAVDLLFEAAGGKKGAEAGN